VPENFLQSVSAGMHNCIKFSQEAEGSKPAIRLVSRAMQ
jgi:hypothetical protein